MATRLRPSESNVGSLLAFPIFVASLIGRAPHQRGRLGRAPVLL